jgi:hypothetical protein
VLRNGKEGENDVPTSLAYDLLVAPVDSAHFWHSQLTKYDSAVSETKNSIQHSNENLDVGNTKFSTATFRTESPVTGKEVSRSSSVSSMSTSSSNSTGASTGAVTGKDTSTSTSTSGSGCNALSRLFDYTAYGFVRPFKAIDSSLPFYVGRQHQKSSKSESRSKSDAKVSSSYQHQDNHPPSIQSFGLASVFFRVSKLRQEQTFGKSLCVFHLNTALTALFCLSFFNKLSSFFFLASLVSATRRKIDYKEKDNILSAGATRIFLRSALSNKHPTDLLPAYLVTQRNWTANGLSLDGLQSIVFQGTNKFGAATVYSTLFAVFCFPWYLFQLVCCLAYNRFPLLIDVFSHSPIGPGPMLCMLMGNVWLQQDILDPLLNAYPNTNINTSSSTSTSVQAHILSISKAAAHNARFFTSHSQSHQQLREGCLSHATIRQVDSKWRQAERAITKLELAHKQHLHQKHQLNHHRFSATTAGDASLHFTNMSTTKVQHVRRVKFVAKVLNTLTNRKKQRTLRGINPSTREFNWAQFDTTGEQLCLSMSASTNANS